MCAISAIPTTRLSNSYMALRTLTQIQSDQRNLFQIQNQLGTGRRINTPSEDAPAAARGMTLQSLLERKMSVLAGINTIQTTLNSSEAALGTASSLLVDVRGVALSAVGNTLSADERRAAVAQVDNVIQQLLNVGNQSFQGKYLFSGSQTQTAPFAKLTNGIAYYGNNNSLMSYSDVDQLFQANATGQQVFGAISDAQRGAVDLNPNVTAGTKLTDLNRGLGVRLGSIAVTDGTVTNIVDVSKAVTIGDVARILEANPPPGRTVTARVSNQGLVVSLDGGNLSISEVGGGSTAAELGIKRIGGTGPGPIVGADLNPQMTLGTQLSDVLGTRARGYLSTVGAGNDLIVEAAHSGSAYNGVTVKYVDDDWFQDTPGVPAGSEFAVYSATATAASGILKVPGRTGLDSGLQLTATTPGTSLNGATFALTVRTADTLGPQLSYNSTTKVYSMSVEAGTTLDDLRTAINASGGPFTAAVTSTGNAAYVMSTADTNTSAGGTYLTGNDANTLAIHIDAGRTTANQVIAALAAEGTFTARLDPSEEKNNGEGRVTDSLSDVTANATTTGGAGQDFDRSGLQIVNGGAAYTVDLSNATTIEDLLNAVNGSGANMIASINAAGTGIDVRSRLSGAEFSIGENGGNTAAQLGIRSLTETAPLAGLNHGAGVNFALTGDDFQITRRDGTTFNVRLADGGRASARLDGSSANSDLLISRVGGGAAGNNFQVRITDSGTGGGDAVSLAGNVLTFNVDVAAGFTAQDAVDLLAADPTLSGQFTAQLDRSTDASNSGAGNLAVTAATNFTGGKNPPLTIGDVIDIINNQPTNLASGPAVTARLATNGNGIELANDGPGGSSTLKITKIGSSLAAADLGLLSLTSDVSGTPVVGNSASATINFPGTNNNLIISARSSGTLMNGVTVHFQNDGVPGNNSVAYNASTKTLTFDVDPATTTAQDIVNLLSGDPQFQAQLTATDGVTANSGAGTLGTLPANSTLAGGTADVLTGRDTNPQEVDGVFTALLNLRAGIESGDSATIQRAIEQLDRSTTNLNFARADLGARMNSLDVIQNRIEVENISIKSALSNEIEVDFASAVSELAQRQASFDASLKVAATLAKTTLLDFI